MIKQVKRLMTLIGSSLLLSPAVAQSVKEGEELIAYERYQRAVNVFQDVLKKNANDADAWLGLTRAFLFNGDSAKAVANLATLPAAIAEEPAALVARGGLLLKQGKIAEAQADFDKALAATREKDADLIGKIADWHVELAQGDAMYALQILEKAIKRDKKNADHYIRQGRAYRKLHKGTEAFQAFREAIDKNKNAAAAYHELGRIFVTQKNEDVYLDYFQQAIAADAGYAPAQYALYNHYLYKDPTRAKEYFLQYQANADASLQQQYDYVDLLYLTNQYDSAIQKADALIASEGSDVKPRMYKLVAYSYQARQDSSKALDYMKNYFAREVDSNYVVKDFETMGLLYAAQGGQTDSAMKYLAAAADRTTDSSAMVVYFRRLAGLAHQAGDLASEAKWMGKAYLADPRASNVALFNWGLTAYKAQDFMQADSAFTIYTTMYPEQGYGYYWRARSNAAIDTAMEQGLAVPHYLQLIEKINKDSMSASDKKWLTEAYAYLASYETNTEKDYPEAVTYFEKLLEVDPANDQARKYIEILEKNIEAGRGTQSADGNGSK